MRKIKLILFNLFFFLIILALIDPLFESENSSPFYGLRSVNLREFPPNSTFVFQPPPGHSSISDNYQIRTDNHGFIIGRENNGILNEHVDIIFFGGSTTECRFVDEGKRFPYLVGQYLSHPENPSKKVATLNGGFSGNHSFHSTINLMAKGVNQQPKVVVLMNNINDLVLLSRTGSYWDSPQSRRIINENKQTGNWPNRIKYFFKSVKNLLCPNIYSRMASILKTAPKDEWEGFKTSPPLDIGEIAPPFEQSLLSFIKIAKTYNIEVVLMTQFNRLRPQSRLKKDMFKSEKDYEDFCQSYAHFNNIIREVAIKENILLIDLDVQVPKEKKYMYDWVHLTGAGSEWVAKIIADSLASEFDFFEIKKEAD